MHGVNYRVFSRAKLHTKHETQLYEIICKTKEKQWKCQFVTFFSLWTHLALGILVQNKNQLKYVYFARKY